MKKILAIAAVLALAGCTNSEQATRALAGAGYRDINITGFRFFGCPENNIYSTGFVATGPGGQRVRGVVCADVFRAATIRFD